MTATQDPLGTRISQDAWPVPILTVHEGRYVDLVPLSVAHADALWPLVATASDSFAYLRYGPFAELSDLQTRMIDLSSRTDQPFWVAIPKMGSPQGWLSICDIYQKDGSIEIGSIWFSPELQGTRAAREAIFLLMCQAMDTLRYERLVWRCLAQNAKSLRAAENLGFTREGTWRRASVMKGLQRDVSWFSILRSEWPSRRQAFERWLATENFDASGRQIKRLNELR